MKKSSPDSPRKIAPSKGASRQQKSQPKKIAPKKVASRRKKAQLAVTKKRSDKLEMFCLWYVGSLGNATVAYKKAYPDASDATAWVEASKSLCLPKVRERIKELLNQQHKGIMMGKNDVLREVSLIASGDLINCYDEDGRLLHPTRMDMPTRMNVSEIETTMIHGSDDQPTISVTKLKFGKDKLAALEKLMKHYNAYEDHQGATAGEEIKMYLIYPEDARA